MKKNASESELSFFEGSSRLLQGSAAPRKPQTHFLPTLFDRLCDDEPSNSQETFKEYAVDRQQLRKIILRDLVNLLNTSNIENQITDATHEHIRNSTINYGIKPLAGAHIINEQWISIERIIRNSIVNFEPRLIPSSISIKPITRKEKNSYNLLDFEISGLINIQPYPMNFIIQSNVDLETNHVILELIN